MAYQLEADETAAPALRRCAREQLDDAVCALTDGVKVDPVRAVHGARKALKKERSLLRLARGSLEKHQRRRENEALRQAAHRLGTTRDSDVIIEALDALATRYAGQVPKATFASIRERVKQSGRLARIELLESKATIEVAGELASARLRVDGWRLEGEGWRAIRDGLRREYRRGRKALERARVEPTPEHVHAWRKRSKDLWYHLRLLRSVSPHSMHGHAQDAHRLSDVLGDDHDLAILRQRLIGLERELPVDVQPVLGLIDVRREELQREAFFLGDRLYAERPKEFVRRVHAYWRAWRTESAAAHDPKQLAMAAR